MKNLTAALPLNPAERKITQSAKVLLSTIAGNVTTHFETLKTQEARKAFWQSLSGWASRNATTCAATMDATASAKPAARAQGKTAQGKSKTRAAGRG
ncbi:MAG TPA: hypothetical protein VHY84_27520 [Bryobacteraceae bacterium]|jgi:hypothetical protein|nr:hypothetical protein [Bryobacteraceae bacterium]